MASFKFNIARTSCVHWWSWCWPCWWYSWCWRCWSWRPVAGIYLVVSVGVWLNFLAWSLHIVLSHSIQFLVNRYHLVATSSRRNWSSISILVLIWFCSISKDFSKDVGFEWLPAWSSAKDERFVAFTKLLHETEEALGIPPLRRSGWYSLLADMYHMSRNRRLAWCKEELKRL